MLNPEIKETAKEFFEMFYELMNEKAAKLPGAKLMHRDRVDMAVAASDAAAKLLCVGLKVS